MPDRPHITRKSILRFARYTSIGVSTFLLDLAVLFLAVTYAHIPYYIATPGAFLIAVSINYHFSRRHVFHQTDRSYHHGYAYYAMIAIAGATLTTSLVALLVSSFGLFYLTARVITAGVIGMGNYLINLYFNFNVAGKH